MLPFQPMLATAGELPSGPGWSYEVKWDGIRALLWVAADGVQITTRHGKPLTEQFPELAAATDVVPSGTLLDGELTVLGAGGKPEFAEIRRRMALRRPHLIAEAAPATLMVFDGPVVAGLDVSSEPIEDRRQRLAELALPTWIRRVTVHPTGDDLMQATRAVGLEGVVAKRHGSPYRRGVRSPDWVKSKHHDTTAMVVVAARRTAGRLTSVLVAHADQEPVGWLDSWAADLDREALAAGIPDGDGVIWGDGPVVAVRHLITGLLREATIVAAMPRR